ncbi:MAG: ABC transporter, partial [Gaiellaceae bacterium]
METPVAAPPRRRLASAGERAEAAELVFDRATKVYGVGAPAVDELSLTVPAGEICALVGPS